MILTQRRLVAPAHLGVPGRLTAVGRLAGPVLALGWLAFITWPYLRAAASSLSRKNDFGTQQVAPALALLALLAGVGLLIGAMRRQRLTRLYAYSTVAGAGLIFVAVLTAGGVAGAAAAVVWLVMLSWAVGERLLRLLFGELAPPRGPERVIFSIALALGLSSHAVLGLALVGMLYHWLALALLLLLSLVLWRDLLDKARALARS